jgi:putative phosphoribosyl transferase
MRSFENRRDAGRQLAALLQGRDWGDAVVLGLPRGGLPVADEVARELGAPLDVLIVRKLGLPRQPELAMGAIGEQGARVVNDDVVRTGAVTDDEFAAVERREEGELHARVRRFRGGRAPLPLTGRTAIVVDDGLATGATARVACQVARARGASRVVLAVPVAPAEVLATATWADEVVCVERLEWFMAVGLHYLDFRQTTDSEVAEILEAAQRDAQ